jgi:hypothetical protein
MSIGVGEPEAAIITPLDEERAERTGALARFFHHARRFLLCLWLGAALFFSFVVTPQVFSVLRDSTALYPNHLAGTIVTRNLEVINTSGFVIALLLLATIFFMREGARDKAFYVEAASLALLALATAVGQWVIAARMLGLRAQMGRPIDETAANDSLRAAFNNLHRYSVAALSVAMLAALVALIFMARRRRAQRTALDVR